MNTIKSKFWLTILILPFVSGCGIGPENGNYPKEFPLELGTAFVYQISGDSVYTDTTYVFDRCNGSFVMSREPEKSATLLHNEEDFLIRLGNIITGPQAGTDSLSYYDKPVIEHIYKEGIYDSTTFSDYWINHVFFGSVLEVEKIRNYKTSDGLALDVFRNRFTRSYAGDSISAGFDYYLSKRGREKIQLISSVEGEPFEVDASTELINVLNGVYPEKRIPLPSGCR